MDLRAYLHAVRRRWRLIVAFAVIVTGIAIALTASATPQYASTSRLFVSTAQGNTSEALQGSLFSAQRVTSYADLVDSRELAETVATALSEPEAAGALPGKVSAQVVPNTVILEISALDPDPRQAQRLAQTYAESMVDLVRELETPPGQTTAPIKATIVDNASLPASPVSPMPVRNITFGLLVGLFLGLLAAIVRELLDTSVKTAEDLAHATDAPLMGAINFDTTARAHPLVTSLDSHAPRIEAFRVLRTNLQFVDVDMGTKLFVVTSALAEEGKTTTSVNLAITLAQVGSRTLLIECDLRRPRASVALGMDASIGVTTILLGKVGLEEAVQVHADSDLHVLSSGATPPNPAELLQSQAMADLLAEARSRYDVVIIDAPPLLPVTDAALLAAQADGALLVVRHGKTNADQVATAVDRLRHVDARLVGVILNMVPTTRRYQGYGYGYGYAPDPVTVTPGTEAPARRRRLSRS